MDEVIFEEFKGTGNSEIVLDRKVSDKRIFPSLDVGKSGTRKEELLVGKDQLSKMWVLRRILMQMGTVDAMEFLLDKMKDSKTNEDFFDNEPYRRRPVGDEMSSRSAHGPPFMPPRACLAQGLNATKCAYKRGQSAWAGLEGLHRSCQYKSTSRQRRRGAHGPSPWKGQRFYVMRSPSDAGRGNRR